MRISVIMGIYNGSKTMDQAIESVCAQTYTDWEYIICDDCSTDNTWEKLQEWKKKDSRIIPVRNEKNLRLAATLNKCLELASGEYIARMDDDDSCYPDRFEVQAAFLDEHPEYGFVSSMVDGYDGKHIIPDYWHRTECPQKRDFVHGSQFVHPATMFRRSVLKQAGGYRIGPETRRMEDYDLFMRLYAAGYQGYNIQKPLLRYYVDGRKTLYRHRIDEAKVRYQGFKALGLLPAALPYVMRPLLVGLIPRTILWKWKTKNKDA